MAMRRTSWIDQRIGVAVLLCLRWFGAAFFLRRRIGAMTDDRHHGEGQHHLANIIAWSLWRRAHQAVAQRAHYFATPKADGPVDKSRPTQVGPALPPLGLPPI